MPDVSVSPFHRPATAAWANSRKNSALSPDLMRLEIPHISAYRKERMPVSKENAYYQRFTIHEAELFARITMASTMFIHKCRNFMKDGALDPDEVMELDQVAQQFIDTIRHGARQFKSTMASNRNVSAVGVREVAICADHQQCPEPDRSIETCRRCSKQKARFAPVEVHRQIRDIEHGIVPAPGSHGRIMDSAYMALTNQEKKVMHMIIENKNITDIAEILSISKKTVENHRSRIYQKLKVKTALGLYLYAKKLGIETV